MLDSFFVIVEFGDPLGAHVKTLFGNSVADFVSDPYFEDVRMSSHLRIVDAPVLDGTDVSAHRHVLGGTDAGSVRYRRRVSGRSSSEPG